MRTVEGILDLIKIILKHLNQSEIIQFNKVSFNSFILETEKAKGRSNTNESAYEQEIFSAAICLFKKFRFTINSHEDCFAKFLTLKSTPSISQKPLSILTSVYSD